MNETTYKTSPTDTADEEDISHESSEMYTISSKVHILQILRDIMTKNTQVTLQPDKSNRLILTPILAIKTATNEVIIDAGAQSELNALALKAKCLTFVTMQEKIRIEFTCHQIKTIQFEDREVFAVNLPESLIRLQRRKNYRLTLSVTQPLKCIIPITTEEKIIKAELDLVDICCGGLSILESDIPIDSKLGTTYQDCQINLPNVGDISVTIKIKGSTEVALKNGNLSNRIRCQFINLTSRAESMLQRYIIQQDRARLSSE